MAEAVNVKKRTSLEELEKQSIGPVFVLNETENEYEAQVVITVPKINGNGVDLIRIPKTFIPIDLTQQVSRRQLMASSEFRKAIGKGHISLVTSEYANLILQQDEAKEEMERLDQASKRARNALRTSGVIRDEEEYVNPDDIKREIREAAAKKSGSDTGMPSVKVEAFVASANEQELKESAIALGVRNLRGLTKADLDYLASKYNDMGRVLNVIKERLDDMRNG